MKKMACTSIKKAFQHIIIQGRPYVMSVTVAIYVNDSVYGVTYIAGNTSWTYTGSIQNTFAITAEDAAGNQSSVSITFSNIKPYLPVLFSPTNDDEIDVSLTPDLQTGDFLDFDGDTHAETQWQISTENDFSTLILDITSTSHITSLSVLQSILGDDTMYYWRARFSDGTTNRIIVDPSGLGIGNQSPTVSSTIPADNATNVHMDTTITAIFSEAADFIANHDRLRAIVRMGLLPIVGMSWFVLKLGPVSTMALILFLGIVIVRLARIRKLEK
jgi:hypothetical protein